VLNDTCAVHLVFTIVWNKKVLYHYYFTTVL